MVEVVVADAGPLIAFGYLKQFDLFPDILGQVLVPEQVLRECLHNKDRPDAVCIQSAIDKGWLTVKTCDGSFLESLPPSLGEGECAAITLAWSKACPVLLDDKLARRAAQFVGLKIVGTAGVLLKAKQIGRLNRVGPELELLFSSGYHLSTILIEKILMYAGEA